MVLTGISDPELVCVLITCGDAVLKQKKSMNSTPADKMQENTLLDLQKRFPMHHVRPKYWAAYRSRSVFPDNVLTFHQELDETGKHWLTATTFMQ